MHAATSYQNAGSRSVPASFSTSTTKISFTFTSPDQIDNVFMAIRHEVDRQSQNARWKIDLALLERQESCSPIPQHDTPRSALTPSLSLIAGECPWNYVVPSAKETWSTPFRDGITHKVSDKVDLKRSHSRATSRAQTEPKTPSEEMDRSWDPSRSMCLFMEGEQIQRYQAENAMLRKDIETLALKLRRVGSILQTIEKMQVPPDEQLLDREELLVDRQLLLRKLHLAELRLTARDAEIDYMRESPQARKAHAHEAPHITRRPATPQTTFHKGSSYLLQQKYSPKLHSEIKSHEAQLSGLERLGIIANQKLRDLDSEGHTAQHHRSAVNEPSASPHLEQPMTHTSSPATYLSDDMAVGNSPFDVQPDARRSQRSIDSANALLSIPSITGQSPHHDNTSLHGKDHHGFHESLGFGHTATFGTSHATDEKPLQSVHYIKSEGDADSSSHWDRVATSSPHPRGQYPVLEESSHPHHSQTAVNANHRQVDARHSPSIAALLDSNEDLKVRQGSYRALSHPIESNTTSNLSTLGYPFSSPHSTPVHSPSPISTSTSTNPSSAMRIQTNILNPPM